MQLSIDAYKIWHGFFSHFPKLFRYTLGADIDRTFLEFIQSVNGALYSSANTKARAVREVSEKLDALKLILRIAWEVRSLDNKKYAALSLPLAEVGKIIGGWKKQL